VQEASSLLIGKTFRQQSPWKLAEIGKTQWKIDVSNSKHVTLVMGEE